MRHGGQCSVVSDTSQLVNYNVDCEEHGCIVCKVGLYRIMGPKILTHWTDRFNIELGISKMLKGPHHFWLLLSLPEVSE